MEGLGKRIILVQPTCTDIRLHVICPDEAGFMLPGPPFKRRIER